jgi:hypothetical protein
MSHFHMPYFVSAISAGLIVAALVGGAAAAPMSDADKAAMKQATATCKAQVKEQAQYNEMSLWARHKAVKNCVKDAMAHH